MTSLYILLGSICLCLGIIGIFVPLLPTTPFLLLTAALYFRGSDRLYCWLLGHKYLGPYIRNFREYRAIPMRAKIISVAMIWLTIGYCIIWMLPQWWLRLLLFALATGISWYICSFKTLGNQK